MGARYYNAAIETMSADELHALQMEKLARQLKYVVMHAPFHAAKLAAVGAAPGDITPQPGSLPSIRCANRVIVC